MEFRRCSSDLEREEEMSKIREARFVDATEGTPDNITNLTDKTYQEGDLFIASRF